VKRVNVNRSAFAAVNCLFTHSSSTAPFYYYTLVKSFLNGDNCRFFAETCRTALSPPTASIPSLYRTAEPVSMRLFSQTAAFAARGRAGGFR
jgi:hypothetical protein